MFKYTKAQIIGLASSYFAIFAISLVLFFLLRNKNEKIRKIPQRIITILLICSEITKLITCLIAKDYVSIYPFYFCSFFWFWFLFADFGRGKFSQSCEAISFTGSIAMTVVLLVNPFSVVGASFDGYIFESYITFHHIFFHCLVSLHLFLSIFLSTYKAKKSHFLYIFIWVLVLCEIIIPAAYALKINYMEVLSSPIRMLENIRISHGQVVYNFILISLFILLLEVIYSLVYIIFKLNSKNAEIKNEDEQKIVNV